MACVANRLWQRAVTAVLCLLWIGGGCAATAAQTGPLAVSVAVMPAAISVAPPDAPGAALLRGSVVDVAGGAIAQARVVVVMGDQTMSAVSDAMGQFEVAGVAGGSVAITVSADGFTTYTGTTVTSAGMASIVLQTATVRSDVQVVATRHDIAAAQVSIAEKQRVLGVIPNFYVTYYSDSAPLSKAQKFQLAWRSTIDPVNLLQVGAVAGIEQGEDEFNGFGQGFAGFGRRYGATLGDNVISTFLGGALLPVIFRQDPRYFYQGTGSLKSRVWHAIVSVVVCHGDNGKSEPNYSNVLGNLAAAGISNAYYPMTDRDSASLTMRNSIIGTAAGAAGNLLQEFLIQRLTPRVATP